jgi:4-oxalomesaconate tautomerase
VQSLRSQAGKLMGLGDVAAASVPKTTLVAAPREGGTICTRTFIPVRPHTSIGVLGAVSVVTALAIPGATGSELAEQPAGVRYDVEHATGHLEVEADIDTSGPLPRVRRCGVVRTARKLFDGYVFPRPGGGTAPGHQDGRA